MAGRARRLACAAVLAAAGYAVYAYRTDSLVAKSTSSAQTRPAEALAAAYTLQQESKLAEAVKGYNAVLGAEPNNMAALYNRGVCFMELGQTSAAEQSLRKVLEISPKHALAALALGELLVRAKRFDEVPAVVEPAMKASPEMADLQALDGLALERTGHPDAAAEAYRNALRFAPGLTRAKNGLARLEASGRE